MYRLLYLFILIPFICSAQFPDGGDLSHDQWFIIHENCSDGDSLGNFVVNFTDTIFFTRTGSYAWAITSGNTNSAFALNSTSGMLTVNANGQINYGSNFDLTVRICVDGLCEYNNAHITVLHEDSCIFFDGSITDPSEDGSIEHPFNSWTDVATLGPDTAYLQKRGTTIAEDIDITSTAYTENQPLIIGAYGKGDRPVLDYSGGSGSVIEVEAVSDSIEYIQIHQLRLEGNDGSTTGAIKIDDYGRHVKCYGLDIYGGGDNGNIQVDNDAYEVWRYCTFYDCVLDSSYGHGLKDGGRGDTAINIYIRRPCYHDGTGNGVALDVSGVRYYRYIHVDMEGTGGGSGIEAACDSADVSYFAVKGFYYALKVDSQNDIVNGANHNHFANGVIDQSIHSAPASSIKVEDQADTNLFENILIRNSTEIYNAPTSDYNSYRSIIIYGSSNGAIDERGDYNTYYNITSYDNGATDVQENGDGTHNEFKNSFYKAMSGTWTTDSIVDIDDITPGDVFYDYTNGDFRLNPDTYGDYGLDVGITTDFEGKSYFRGWWVGAYEYNEDDFLIDNDHSKRNAGIGF